MDLSFFKKKWHFRHQKENEKNLYELFLKARKLNPTDEFLSPNNSHLSDPDNFPEMQKACERVYSAIQKNEKILVFGDYDLDGISGAAILFRTLKLLGANVSVWLPSRADGFGLTKKYAQSAIERKFDLVITTDCGFSDYNSVVSLKEQGIDTIITDHHSIPKKIPPYYAIIHPQYPIMQDTLFAGAGVALKFAQGLLKNNLPAELLEFSALGTVADLVELTNENRIIVALGIECLKKTKNPGLQRLFALSGTKQNEIDVEKIAFFIAPRLNSAGRMAHPMEALALLLGKVENAPILEKINSERQLVTEKYIKQILEELDHNQPALVVKTDATAGIIGLLAGRLQERFNKPVVVLSEEENEFKASCRSPEDFHLADSLKELSSHFLAYGGHAQAAGFSLIKENYSNFEKDFHNLVLKKRGNKPPAPLLKIDAQISLDDLSLESVEQLLCLAPFGAGFSAPVFSIKAEEIYDSRCVGKTGKHLLFRCGSFSAIAFSCADALDFIHKKGSRVEIAFTPEINTWNGSKSVKLKVYDFR